MREALRAAVAESTKGDEGAEGTAEAETPDPETPASDASTEGTAASSTPATETPETPAPAEGTEDPPTSYFGYEFPPDLTAEQRQGIISELRKRDDTIGKLLRKQSDAAPPEGEAAPEPPAELSDEDILAQLGLDPANPFDEQAAKLAVPLVRQQLAQERALATLIEESELAELDRSWRSSLAGLEKEFGELPSELDADAVMAFAAENGIGSPVDAFWRIMGPTRANLSAAAKGELEKARTASKRAASGTRPTSDSSDGEPEIQSKTVKGATREVLGRALKQLGIDT